MSEIQNYLLNGLMTIPGWLGVGAAQLILAIDECQINSNIGGDYFEIGVHHGRTTSLLGLMAKNNSSKVSVCDIFSNQESNISMSGRGNRKEFEKNYQRWVGSLDDLTIYDCNSNELKNKKIKEHFRLFYIDGGHSTKETSDDLSFAFEHLVAEGVVMIDDVHNFQYPGVSEGLHTFLSRTNGISPVIVGKNKVVLCKESSYDKYFKYFTSNQEGFTKKLVEESAFTERQEYYGREVIIYAKRK